MCRNRTRAGLRGGFASPQDSGRALEEAESSLLVPFPGAGREMFSAGCRGGGEERPVTHRVRYPAGPAGALIRARPACAFGSHWFSAPQTSPPTRRAVARAGPSSRAASGAGEAFAVPPLGSSTQAALVPDTCGIRQARLRDLRVLGLGALPAACSAGGRGLAGRV